MVGPSVARLTPPRVVRCQPAQQADATSCSRDRSTPRQRSRGKAVKRGAVPGNPLSCRVLAPRSVRLPLLYSGSPPSGVDGAHAAASTSADIAPSGSGGAPLLPSRASSVEPGVVPIENQAVPTSMEKVECLLHIFDVNDTGFLGFGDLCTLFSVLSEKEWADGQRFAEWCGLLGADPKLGLDVAKFGKLLSLEHTFLDDAFRLLGLQAMSPDKLALPPPGLRVELLRASLDAGRPFFSRLAQAWYWDFLRLMAAELMPRLPVCWNVSPVGMTPGTMLEALENLLQTTHELIDATVSSVKRWHTCFQDYLKRGSLDSSVQEWATFDATWGAKIAALMAQIRGVEIIKNEVAAAGTNAGIDLVSRYLRAVASLVPTLEASRQHGLIVPAKQLAKVEALAKRIQKCNSAELPPCDSIEQDKSSADTHPRQVAHARAATHPSASPCKMPSQPRPQAVGPRRRKDERAAAYVRSLQRKAFPKSAPTTPVDRSGKVTSTHPWDRGGVHSGATSVPATPVDGARDASSRRKLPAWVRVPATTRKQFGKASKQPPASPACPTSHGEPTDANPQTGEPAGVTASGGVTSGAVDRDRPEQEGEALAVPAASLRSDAAECDECQIDHSLSYIAAQGSYESAEALGMQSVTHSSDGDVGGAPACDAGTRQSNEGDEDGSESLYDSDFCSEDGAAADAGENDRLSPDSLDDGLDALEAPAADASSAVDGRGESVDAMFWTQPPAEASSNSAPASTEEKPPTSHEIADDLRECVDSSNQSHDIVLDARCPLEEAKQDPSFLQPPIASDDSEDSADVEDILKYREQLYQKTTEQTVVAPLPPAATDTIGSGKSTPKSEEAQLPVELYMTLMPMIRHGKAGGSCEVSGTRTPNLESPRAPSSADGSSVYELDLDRELCLDPRFPWETDGFFISGASSVQELEYHRDSGSCTFRGQPIEEPLRGQPIRGLFEGAESISLPESANTLAEKVSASTGSDEVLFERDDWKLSTIQSVSLDDSRGFSADFGASAAPASQSVDAGLGSRVAQAESRDGADGTAPGVPLDETWPAARRYVVSEQYPKGLRLCVRTGPSEQSEVITMLPADTEYFATGRSGDYLQIQHFGTTAYVTHIVDGMIVLVRAEEGATGSRRPSITLIPQLSACVEECDETWPATRRYVCSDQCPEWLRLSVRTKPSESSDIITMLPADAEFFATGICGDYLKIQHCGTTAYVTHTMDGLVVLVRAEEGATQSRRASKTLVPQLTACDERATLEECDEIWPATRRYVCSEQYPESLRLTVRSGPSEHSEVITMLPAGSEFFATGRCGDYLQIQHCGARAYVTHSVDGQVLLVRAEEGATGSRRPSKVLIPQLSACVEECDETWPATRRYVYSQQYPEGLRLTVRSGPSEHSDVITMLPAGSEFFATGICGDYLQIQHCGASAYVTHSVDGQVLLVRAEEGASPSRRISNASRGFTELDVFSERATLEREECDAVRMSDESMGLIERASSQEGEGDAACNDVRSCDSAGIYEDTGSDGGQSTSSSDCGPVREVDLRKPADSCEDSCGPPLASDE